MQRRELLKHAAAGAASLAAPRLARAAGASTLIFAPQADLAQLDPVWVTAYVTRNHAFLVFDTLYGLDENYQPQPQMVEGHVVENPGYFPLGQFFQATAYRSTVSNIPRGSFSLFWGIKKG